MIRRIVTPVIVVALLGGAALLTPPPTATPPPTTAAPDAPEPLAFATCPWSFTDGLIDSAIVLVAESDREVTLTSPTAEAERSTNIIGPGASVVRQSDIGAGVSPLVAEFSAVPAAAGITASAPGIAAGLTCPNAATKLWVLAGGSTVGQQPLDLMLFNPFPEDATVELRFVSENGAEPLTELERVSVAARSVRVIDIEALLPSRLHVAVAVDDPAGLVTPAFRTGPDDADWAVLSASSQSDRWEFPVAGVADHDAVLILVNEGPVPVTAGVDVFLPGESRLAAAEITIEARRLAVFEIDDDVSGLSIDADGPLGAAVVGAFFDARYATSGVDRTARVWHLTPGAGPEQLVSVRLMNTSATPVTVSVTPIGPAGVGSDPDKVSVDPGTIRDVELLGAVAVLLESGDPFSAGWHWSVDLATAASQGVPVN